MPEKKRIAYIIKPDKDGKPVVVGTREFDRGTHTHAIDKPQPESA